MPAAFVWPSSVNSRNGLGLLETSGGVQVKFWNAASSIGLQLSTVRADDFNNNYALILTDTEYEPPLLRATASPPDTIVFGHTIVNILDHQQHTTTSYDGLQAWCLRMTVPAYSGITCIINQSISQ